MTDEPTTPLDVAQAYHAAWTSGDLDGAMKYVSDDIVIHAPGDEISGKEGYSEYLGGFMKMLTGVTNLGAYGGNDGAMLFYFPHTQATKTAPTAEFFKISDGKITESTLLFDRPSFGPPEQ